MGSSSSWRWVALVLFATACGGRTGLDVPGDACLGVSADCDGDVSNGCEADLDTNAQHCGACGVTCEAGLACSEGTCVEGRRIVQLDARTATQFARTADGRVYAWGNNEVGQIDKSLPDPVIYTPRQVPLPGPSAEISVGWIDACSRGVDGTVWCWGTGEALFKKEGLVGVTKLMSDRDGYCTLDAYRIGKCWTMSPHSGIYVGSGGGPRSTVGGVVYEMSALPKPLSFLLPGAAITADGELITWGYSALTGRATPSDERNVAIGVVAGVHDVVRIDSGSEPGLCVTERHGDIVCWGAGFDAEHHVVPNRLFVDGPYKRAAFGPWTCALRVDGELRCVDNGFLVVEASQIAEVSASVPNICVVTFDDRLMCLGNNESGGLGQDPAVLAHSPDFVEITIPR